MLGKILGGVFGKLFDNAEGILDEIITTDEEREQAKLHIKKLLQKREKQKDIVLLKVT